MALPKHLHYLFLASVLLSFNSGEIAKFVNGQKTWCVVKPWANITALQGNIDYACSKINCSVIQEGGPCYYPVTLQNHASIAMNFYYQSHGKTQLACDFRASGLITITDPSYGACKW